MTWRPAEPEDFVVDEIPLYAPSGAGGHTFVRVEKRGVTTEEVARALARAVGAAPGDVGYAGRKDRFAVARQWLSVPGLDPARAAALELPGARVLEAVRHPHKLRTAQLRGNAFALVVRGIDDAAAARACARFESIRALGLPNRYGAQRFGRDAQNAARGAALLGGRERVRDRRTARFLVSALQAAVFNAALDRRTLPLDAVEPGDVAVVHASGGLFRVETLAREAPRAARFEISATGPLPGARVLEPTGAPAAREREALAACGLDPETPIVAPRGLRLRGARRPLRVPVAAAALVRDGSTLRLSFHLPPGAYATVLVDELLAAAGIEPQPAVGSRPGAGGLP